MLDIKDCGTKSKVWVVPRVVFKTVCTREGNSVTLTRFISKSPLLWKNFSSIDVVLLIPISTYIIYNCIYNHNIYIYRKYLVYF